MLKILETLEISFIGPIIRLLSADLKILNESFQKIV